MLTLLSQDVNMILSVMSKYYPAPGNIADYCNNSDAYRRAVEQQSMLHADLIKNLNSTGREPQSGDVKYIFTTRAGPGPIRQPFTQSLLSPQTGLPVPPQPGHEQMKIMSAPKVVKNDVVVSTKNGCCNISCGMTRSIGITALFCALGALMAASK
jgi:hypothetical protein